MSSDVAMFDDELKSLEDQLQNCLRQMETASGEARQAKYNKAQDLLKVAQKNFHHFKVEMRQLEPHELAVYEKKSAQHNAIINQLKDQLTAKRQESAAPGGPGGDPNGGYSPMGGDGRDDGKQKARQTKDRIATTQATAIDVLTRIEKTVEETKDVGDQAAQKLALQTEQMERMNSKLDKLDSEVDRAKGELNAFIRRMMTDKIILCFILLVIIAVVVIVVIKLKDPDAGDSPPPPPATPIVTAPPPTSRALHAIISRLI